ncbi:MAG: PRTRC system ThiF family protein [Cyclobacteriaceae bacterium]
MRKPRIHYLPQYLLSGVHPITINVIGCGGTGSHLLTQLARIDQTLRALEKPGLTITAIDPDHVTEHNMGRQLFTHSDLNLNKSEVLITRINRAFGLSWRAIPYAYNETLVKSYNDIAANLTISCVDTSATRYQISRIFTDHLRKRGHHPFKPYYWMDLGNSQHTGQCILGTVSNINQPKSRTFKPLPKLPTITDKYPNMSSSDKDEIQGPSCSIAQALTKQDLFINSLLAQYAGNLLWNLFNKGFTCQSGLFINLSNYKSSPIPLP